MKWSRDEDNTLRDLYEEAGDKTCLSWAQIASDLNDEYGHGRSVAAAKARYYRIANAGSEGLT